MNKRLTRLLPLCGFLILAACALWAQNQPKPKSPKGIGRPARLASRN